MDTPTFNSIEDEMKYWKEQFLELQKNHEEYKEQKEQTIEEIENEVLTLEEKALDYEIKYEQEKQDKDDLIVNIIIFQAKNITETHFF